MRISETARKPAPPVHSIGRIKNASMRSGAGVKEPSWVLAAPVAGISLDIGGHHEPVARFRVKECAAVADLAYAVLLIGGFLVLALTLRGLERL
ncbi:hypothetical protein [Saccharopolyspora shandongensis]|uniref:hypothetical protein n=1 Tax=Saccharopolyspora shandongensis TaxID=418495 RepID=UPI003401B6C8